MKENVTATKSGWKGGVGYYYCYYLASFFGAQMGGMGIHVYAYRRDGERRRCGGLGIFNSNITVLHNIVRHC